MNILPRSLLSEWPCQCLHKWGQLCCLKSLVRQTLGCTAWSGFHWLLGLICHSPTSMTFCSKTAALAYTAIAILTARLRANLLYTVFIRESFRLINSIVTILISTAGPVMSYRPMPIEYTSPTAPLVKCTKIIHNNTETSCSEAIKPFSVTCV